MKISIQKYDPSVDESPYVVDYDIPWHESMTLLEALTAVNDEEAPVVFDFSCRGRDCGRCAMALNGTPCLACVTLVDEQGLKKFAGPTQMIATALRFYDPYDQGDRVLEAVQNGLFNCIQCGTCDEVCKALEIDHLATWADLRAAAEERGLA